MKDVFTEFEDNLSPVLMIEIINKSKTITSECLGNTNSIGIISN